MSALKLDHVGAGNSSITLGSPYSSRRHGRDESSAQEGEEGKERKHGRTVRVTRDRTMEEGEG